MLSEALKKQIQGAYSTLLSNKGHRARQGQKLMIAAIARTLGAIHRDDDGVRTSDPAIVAVEAGTGTGKTIAYALAAIPIAQAAEKTLVISTATVALQEQIVHKDLPDIRRHSGLSFNFTLAKGRGRYLCLSKLDQLLQGDSTQLASLDLFAQAASALPADQQQLYRRMLEQLASNRWDGDRDNWADALSDDEWRRVTTDQGQCTGRRCSNVNNCAFFKAREGLGKSDVVVANHDLVLADLALGGGAILPPPKDCIYVFDEGHHLPDKAIGHFSHFTRLKGSAGWLDQSAKSLTKVLGQHQWPGELPRYVEQLIPVLGELAQEQILVFSALEQLADFALAGEQNARQRPVYRFVDGRIPESLQTQAKHQAAGFSRVAQLLEKICDELTEAMDGERPGIATWDAEALYPQLGLMLARTQATEALWRSYAEADAEDGLPMARWLSLIETDSQFDLEVSASPILASPTLRAHLWYAADAVVITSATLTALGRFERFRMRSGMPAEAVCQTVASPFNYQAAVLEIPPLRSEPRQAEEHTQELIELMPDLLQRERGSLVLFASRKQMQEVYYGLEADLRAEILLQDDYSKQQLLARHRARIDEGARSTIFGLASMAEGVDLPGAYCEQVIIAKLPFAVPDDPVEAALAEWLERQGRNPFMEIAVPDAATKLVQACGRLLRTESDRGRICLLDKRLLTKRYGQVMLASLPPYERRLGRH